MTAINSAISKAPTAETDLSQICIGQPLFKLLQTAAAQYTTRPAVTFQDTTLSYTDLLHAVETCAAGLQSIGVEKGTKVGLFLPNTPFSIIGYFAILRAGGTVVNYNPLYAVPELAFQVTDSETDILITLNNEMLVEKAAAVHTQTNLSKIILCGDGDLPQGDIYRSWDSILSAGAEHVFTAPSIDPNKDTAVLQYTGGTTGTPKAAVLSHANISINAAQFEHVVQGLLEPGQERLLGVLPLFHVFAMTVNMASALKYGMEILLFSRFDPKQLAPVLKEKQPTVLPAVPAMFAALSTHTATKDIDLSCIKFAPVGGAPIAPEIKALFENQSGAHIVEAYGLTETSPVATCNPPLGVIKTGSVGLPIIGTTIEILDLENGETVLGKNEKGEVCISGPQVMSEYFNKPDETANVLKNGRLHTGDIGYLDDDGYLFLVDRLKDMILVSGYNVYPTQIEAIIHEHPSVEECIVAGVPDDKRGEAVYAWIKCRDGMSLTDTEMKSFLRDKISNTEMPRRILFKDEPLPKTAVGKLSRKMMLEQEGYA